MDGQRTQSSTKGESTMSEEETVTAKQVQELAYNISDFTKVDGADKDVLAGILHRISATLKRYEERKV